MKGERPSSSKRASINAARLTPLQSQTQIMKQQPMYEDEYLVPRDVDKKPDAVLIDEAMAFKNTMEVRRQMKTLNMFQLRDELIMKIIKNLE